MVYEQRLNKVKITRGFSIVEGKIIIENIYMCVCVCDATLRP